MRSFRLCVWVAGGMAWALSGCDGALNLSGRVVDEGGHPVVGARVSAYSAVPETSDSTDENGCFHIFHITSPSEHVVPFLVTANGRETFLGSIRYPKDKYVIVHAPALGRSQVAVLERSDPDPICARLERARHP